MNKTLLVLIVSWSSACVTTTPVVPATGEPLEARGHSVFVPRYLNDDFEWVEAHEDYDYDGLFQGDTKIDELDFYHIAGDTQAEQKIVAWRDAVNLSITTTWAALGAGVAVAAGGGVVLAIEVDGDESYQPSADKPVGLVALGLIAGGVVLMGASYVVGDVFMPTESLEDGQLFPESRADAAATAYNERKGLTIANPSPEPF